MNQIPDVKVFYTRFVKPEALAEVDDELDDTESTQVVIFTFPYFIFTAYLKSGNFKSPSSC